MFIPAPEYNPGDPYEFDGPHPYREGEIVRMYHCFRGKCHGRSHWVSDRNTHNMYHNGTWRGGLGLDYWESDDYEYEWEF